MDKSETHPQNAERSMHKPVGPDMNINSQRLIQPVKHFAPSLTTEPGMQMDRRDEQAENALSSISESRESDSNVTLESLVHEEKQLSQSLSIDDGTGMRSSTVSSRI
jgi:hypothetical protein